MSTPPLALTVDDHYDRDNASDRVSRYGAYLAQNARLFLDDGVPTADVSWFAFSAWEIASSPIMAPGYVQTHPRVVGAEPHWDEDGRPALTVRLVAPHPLRVPEALGRNVRTWEPQRDVNQGIYAWSEPWNNDRLSAYTTLTVRVPVVANVLPTPRYRSGIPDTATAKHAVKTLCAVVNPPISYLIAALDAPRCTR
ncbi:MAG TPA: hypothetical protein VHX38_40640 [Pseudonocardiaceae bacterium]|jgi:hypothetical protein|nr:hypothetical protein [Pseudonocardiaceae bacterium]